jgi:hypothetical protein
VTDEIEIDETEVDEDLSAVTNKEGIEVATVPTALLRDFLNEVLSSSDSPMEILDEYGADQRRDLIRYLAYRVIEVNPGDVTVPH